MQQIMQKVILITGATDGIGFETAKVLVEQGHHVLLHGRNPDKLKGVESELATIAAANNATIESYEADLSSLKDTVSLADALKEKHTKIDVLINNAGVFNTANPITKDDLDVRFVVNTIAPYLLTLRLLPLLGETSRVVNLSSAAQSTVSVEAILGKKSLSDGEAYAQSKLAITMWTRELAEKTVKNELNGKGPMLVAVNPASLLGSKMVKDAYGVAGGDLSIGSDILVRAALSDEFANASGLYFDNDRGVFSKPHPDALNDTKVRTVVQAIESVIDSILA